MRVGLSRVLGPFELIFIFVGEIKVVFTLFLFDLHIFEDFEEMLGVGGFERYVFGNFDFWDLSWEEEKRGVKEKLEDLGEDAWV